METFKKHKNYCIATFLFLAVAFLLLAMASMGMFVAKADAITTFNMKKGAAVRYGEDATDMGIRFTATISDEEYTDLLASVGEDKAYDEVSFGMLIAPENYLKDYADFTLDNLFGNTPKYDWAVFENDEWVYRGHNGAKVDGVRTPVRIINIQSKTLSLDDEDPTLRVVNGALIDYELSNIVRSFVGRAYIRFVDGENVTYQLANYTEDARSNNTRSMIEVAQMAMQDNSGEVSDDAKTSLQTTYMNTIADNIAPVKSLHNIVQKTTVSGATYNGKHLKSELLVEATFGDIKEQFKVLDWDTTRPGQIVASNGEVQCNNERILNTTLTAKYFPDITVEVDCYVPISSKADLDYLGYAFRDGQNTRAQALWNNSAAQQYMLTNDIDCAVKADGSVATVADRYLVPIAARADGNDGQGGVGTTAKTAHWGIFGTLNNYNSYVNFATTLDGNGYSIKNAIIPYGSAFYDGAYTAKGCLNNNFIGCLTTSGCLKNIAFDNLKFETPVDIFNYASDEPAKAMYTSANTNLDGTKFATNGYLVSSDNSGALSTFNYGGKYTLNDCYGGGLISIVTGTGTVENVYVDAIITNGAYTGNNQMFNGVLVSRIVNANSIVRNCVVKTGIWSELNWNNANNAGTGAVIGAIRKDKTNANVENCFAISYEANAEQKINALTTTSIFAKGYNFTASQTQCTNCAVYSSAEAFEEAQSALKDVITIYDWSE